MEAGGQFTRGFRCGLDYAFILMTAIGLQDAERVMPRLHRDILVPARKPKSLFSESMSLYRAGLKLAFFLPLGVTMPLSLTAPSGFTDVSSVLIRSLRIGATLDRTPVRKHYISGSTYVAVSLFSRFALPEQQGRR